MKRKIWYFQTKLALVQIFLVLPILALLSFGLFFQVRKSALEAIDASRNDFLQTAAVSFDQIYLRMIKLLEKPYTDTVLYDIITTEYSESGNRNKNLNDAQTNKLLGNIIYYEPNIASITLVLDNTNSVYYKRRAPSISVNVHNEDWYDLTQSSWYQEAMDADSYLVAPAVCDELYLKSGVTIPIAQRLMNVLKDQKIGVFRIDLGIESFYPGWNQVVQDRETDIFVVLDSYERLIYSSSREFEEDYPLLSEVDTGSFGGNYHVNRYTAPESGLQFLYLSTDFSALNLKQPLFMAGSLFLLFYVVYAAVFIRWSSHYISEPIQKLKTAMMTGQENQLWVRCEPLKGEMGDLSKAFNQLMERMELLIQEATSHEQEKARLSYEVLQSKINPHFLYNTLNAIRYRADRIGAKEISHGLECLASLLRFTIKCTDEVIPFSQELEQLENYIQIMRIRYGDDVDIDFDIDEECYQYKCLKFLIQPVIENCYVHAFGADKAEAGTVLVTIVCEEESILVTVTDNGMGMTDEQLKKITESHAQKEKSSYSGIGIDNVRQRLETLFGKEYTLQIESRYGAYTTVTARIPKLPL
ncbi:MAG: histidine kinase [Hungatella hathewayi]|nr:histidine kinase [Hungatella hathewayi]